MEGRSIINGALLRQHQGKNVSIFVKVQDCGNGHTVSAKTTDGYDVRVNFPEAINSRPDDWIEVIGSPAGADAIRAKEAIHFSENATDFDTESHNILVQLLHNCKDIFQLN